MASKAALAADASPRMAKSAGSRNWEENFPNIIEHPHPLSGAGGGGTWENVTYIFGLDFQG